MSDKVFDVMLTTALKHVADHAERAENWAKVAYDLLAGDGDPEEIYAELRTQGYVDENDEWIEE